jgi:hypothetical protein
MQSYGKFIYPVNETNLPHLGSLMKLPSGWSYNHIPALSNELRVKAENAIGVIVQDDFQDVYSRFDSSLLGDDFVLSPNYQMKKSSTSHNPKTQGNEVSSQNEL